MKLDDLYPDLMPILKGARFKRFCDDLYKLAMIRYATFEQLNAINSQVFTKTKVPKLADLGYLAISQKNICTIGHLARPLLSDQSYNISVIQKKMTAISGTHPLRVSEVLLSLMGEEDFFSVIYPHFTFVIPDACVIKRRENAVKIQMVEVESHKANWQEYLEVKRRSYEQLARDEEIWSIWWKHICRMFGLNHCRYEEFCFSVLCCSQVSFEFPGWEWRNE